MIDMFYIRYTVTNPALTTLVAGPYTADEVLDQRRDIASYAYVTDCHVFSLGDDDVRSKGDMREWKTCDFTLNKERSQCK
jgi:hypothetical protein